MKQEAIFFLGGGHGGLAAFLSLQKKFQTITVFTNDENLVALMRAEDRRVSSLEEITEKIGVMAGFLEILKSDFLKEKLVLNVHYSLLPRWRGMHSVAWAVINGDNKLGWSVHRAVDAIDAGDIYYQQSYQYSEETSPELMKIFNKEVSDKLGSVVNEIIEGKISPFVQNEELATWGTRRNGEDCHIDFNSKIEHLKRFFKALAEPYPLPFFNYKKTKYEVLDCSFVFRDYIGTNGRVVNADERGIYIKVTDGFIIVDKIRNTSGEIFSAKAKLPLGARLK